MKSIEQQVTTFPNRTEFEKAKHYLETKGLCHEFIFPEPGFKVVAEPAIIMDLESRASLMAWGEVTCSGWVDYRPPLSTVPSNIPPTFTEDVFGRAAIMVLATCVADTTKIRIIAHISGDLEHVFPYLNAQIRSGYYNPNGPTFTFMDGYRMISMYPSRITVAKADEIVDGWRTLENIRCIANDAWARRHQITPCYQMRERPPALEIFKRLPKTNCRKCGELTCLAFAVKVYMGEAEANQCKEVFGGKFEHLREPLIEICRGMGV